MKDRSIFLLAFALSIFLWMQLQLTKSHTQIIDIPVKIINVPQDNYIVDQSDNVIPIEFRGKGINLIKAIFDKPMVVIDVKKYNDYENKLQINEDMLVYTEKNDIAFQSIDGNSIFEFKIDKFQEDAKTIFLNYKSAEDREYFLKNEVSITPQKVQVFGPGAELREIKAIYSKPISVSDLSKGKLEIELLKPENVQLHTQTVVVQVEESEIVEKYLTLIPITIPQDFEKTIVPQKVSVLIKGPQKIIKNIEASDIIARLKKGFLDKEYADIDFKLPENIELIDYSPEKVRIIENE